MNREHLIQNLDAAGKRTTSWESPDGSRVLVLPYGGRVLGLFSPDQETNFLWTHAALENASTAQHFYQSAEWHNSGGDRTWLAPEIDFFCPDYPDLGRYWQQRALDPGEYTLSQKENAFRWSTSAELTLSRTKQRVAMELDKTLHPALNPLRYDPLDRSQELQFAGYSLTTTLRLVGDNLPEQVGLWQLLQMPHGGEMIVPTFAGTQPKIYMGSVSAEDLLIEPHLVRYKMQAVGEHKLGIRATDLTGRAGYLWHQGAETSLVIRNFTVNPSGEYVDVPGTEPDNVGFAFQACNVNSGLGAFSEMEYHVPAVGSKSGTYLSTDESQVWAFRGSENAVRSVARRLLSPIA